MNLNLCEEYKTVRDARGPNKTERDDWIARSRYAQIRELRARQTFLYLF